eukprot:c23189_g1_i1 orf=57-1775(+)
MRGVRYVAAMASTASSSPVPTAACASLLSRRAISPVFCKQSHRLFLIWSLHGVVQVSKLGLHIQSRKQQSGVSGAPQKLHKLGFLQEPGLGLGLQGSKLHQGVAFAQISTNAEVGLELQKKPPLGLGSSTDELPTSVYVHLPFCKRRCFYCDFAIVAIGERNKTSSAHIDSTMDAYIGSVCTEITSTIQQSPHVRPLKTLFFGGGTPSLVPAHHLSRIIDTLECCCGFEKDVEISMEMDPGTFNKLTLSEFLDCGVNRVSLGVQTFHDDFLKACGRSHGLQDVYEAIDLIHVSGIRNWSLDLICSLPNQTLELWEESLRKAIDVAPAHISVYDLQIEEGTKFGMWYKPGQHPLPNEESSAAFYRLASSLLREAGYEHYEISNYAKPGHECRHNMVYWKNDPYYAFGLGATSYVCGQRFSRPKKWKEYADFVKDLECSISHLKQENSGSLENVASSTHDANVLESDVDKLCDTIMLSLRLACGLDLRSISQNFGHDWTMCICKAFVPFVDSGHAIALDADLEPMSPKMFSNSVTQVSTSETNGGVLFIRLDDPEGFLLSNEIISSVFSSLPGK